MEYTIRLYRAHDDWDDVDITIEDEGKWWYVLISHPEGPSSIGLSKEDFDTEEDVEKWVDENFQSVRAGDCDPITEMREDEY